jgi:hypothetical protein
VGRLPYVVPPNGAMYTKRSALVSQSTTLLTHCTPYGVLLVRGKQRWPRPSRLGGAGAEHALGSGPPQKSCFTGTESAPAVVERLTEHAHVSKRSFSQHFSG